MPFFSRFNVSVFILTQPVGGISHIFFTEKHVTNWLLESLIFREGRVQYFPIRAKAATAANRSNTITMARNSIWGIPKR